MTPLEVVFFWCFCYRCFCATMIYIIVIGIEDSNRLASHWTEALGLYSACSYLEHLLLPLLSSTASLSLNG